MLDSKLTMVLGHDIDMNRVVSLSESALVKKFQHQSCRQKELLDWCVENWKPNLGLSECSSFGKGVVMLHISGGEEQKSPSRGLLAVKEFKHCAQAMALWFRTSNGDIRRVVQHIWVLLPRFPLPSWNVAIFKKVGNRLGKFLLFDEASLRWEDKVNG